MQGGDAWPVGTPAEPQSEDCLYLNIWRPAGVAASARLPVMVWIPGGGWTDGSGSAPLYDGGRLAQRGVIVVTINYRVGAFGFLAHAALARENAQASSGNYGLLDQFAALRWVQRNIGAFGGDSHRVTIFGESAGSMSVNLLTVSPPARGLFQRVIGQSGAVFIPPEMVGGDAFHLAGAQAQGERFAPRSAPRRWIDCARCPQQPSSRRSGSSRSTSSSTRRCCRKSRGRSTAPASRRRPTC
jgi:para-nitrobenzyl esterase